MDGPIENSGWKASHICYIGNKGKFLIYGGRGPYNDQGVYCGLSTASEVFLIFTTQLYQYFSVFSSICTI